MSRSEAELWVQATSSLRGVARALTKRARSRHGESVDRLVVLQAVSVSGQTRVGAIAELLATDLSAVSRKVTALEAQGLVHRVVDPRDRRAQLIALTPKGDQLLASLRASAGASLAEALSTWSRSDIELLVRLLTRLEADLTAADRRADPEPVTASNRDELLHDHA